MEASVCATAYSVRVGAAVVYRSKGPGGQPAARKVFIGSSLAGLVNVLLLGTDNPYIWNRAAVQEAACRRRILARLVAWWLPGKARVAEVFAGRLE